MHLRRFAILSIAATLLAALTRPRAARTGDQGAASPPTATPSGRSRASRTRLPDGLGPRPQGRCYRSRPALEKAYAASKILVLEIDADSLNLPEVGEQMLSRVFTPTARPCAPRSPRVSMSSSARPRRKRD